MSIKKSNSSDDSGDIKSLSFLHASGEEQVNALMDNEIYSKTQVVCNDVGT